MTILCAYVDGFAGHDSPTLCGMRIGDVTPKCYNGRIGWDAERVPDGELCPRCDAAARERGIKLKRDVAREADA